jgi:hypothetical protein
MRTHSRTYTHRRFFLIRLKQYVEYWYVFAIISGDDTRVDKSEWMQGLPHLAACGVVMDDPLAEFDKIDENGGGLVLFAE